MKYKRIAGIEKPMSCLVQGTMMINALETDRWVALLDDVFDLGCTVFDTAHDYGQGIVERTVGSWVNQRGLRHNVVIIGKGAHHNQDRKRVTTFDITSDLYDSLARFGFDYIDLYLLHRDDTSVPVGPIIEVLNEHLKAGLIKAIGCSNWTHERVQEANCYAEAHGLIPFVVSSPNFCLADQIEEPWTGCVSISGLSNQEARNWYMKEHIALFPWSSLASGFLTGRFTRDNIRNFEVASDVLCVRTYGCERNFSRLERANVLAKEKGLTIPQIAIAYILNQPLNTFPIVGCRHGYEYKEDAEAISVVLTSTEIAWLELRTDER